MPDSAEHLQSHFSTRHFRDALGSFASGVTIVTTLDAQGQPAGLTVSSFASVSLEPPLVLWSLLNASSHLQDFLHCQHFAINVLAADQLLLAQRFATPGLDRFRKLRTVSAASGVPLLPGALAWFECRRHAQHLAGDHTIFIGQVERVGYRGAWPRELPGAEPAQCPQALAPLLYHRGILHQGTLPMPAAAQGQQAGGS